MWVTYRCYYSLTLCLQMSLSQIILIIMIDDFTWGKVFLISGKHLCKRCIYGREIFLSEAQIGLISLEWSYQYADNGAQLNEINNNIFHLICNII